MTIPCPYQECKIVKINSFIRDVNFANLQRHLSDIEIESCNNWNFSTALDLTEELGSSLLYFVDTSNELVFLKKLKRHRLLPYPYDEINITDHVELDNRIKFLENELNHRSYRMNQLFHRLQKVVTPSIIDDIRYVHCVSYQKSWCKRAHYWFSEFKEIQRDQYFSRTVESLPSKYQKSYGKIKDEFDVTNNVHIKSDDVVATSKTSFDRKTVKIKKSKIKKAKSSKIRSKDAKLRAGRPTTKSGKINQTMSSYANVWKTLQNLTNLVQNLEPGADNGNESDQSNSFEIIEPNVSVISISEDDDWSDDAHPSGGCTTKN